MPQTVTTLNLLQRYVRGVLGKAEHHAENVDEVCLVIAGAIIWRNDGEIEVMTRDGDMKNVLWMRVNGSRYALSYNHDAASIEVREGSTRGAVLARFSNGTPTREVKAFFRGL